MKDIFLILGGNGFVGNGVMKAMSEEKFKIRCIDMVLPKENEIILGVEYIVGDIYDEAFFINALDNVDTVLNFISTTMPNSGEISLEKEIYSTLKMQNYILKKMADAGVSRYVFPSSGGAIYGDKDNETAHEDDKLFPKTPYGVGKKMCEDIISYYSEKCGISAYIFRIGNVYGSTNYRKKAQGVIDVFIQNALLNEEICIWGNAEKSVRDYVYMEDVSNAICQALKVKREGINIYNIGTGIGTSLKEIIDIISKMLKRELKIVYKGDMASGVSAIVLSNEKIRKEIGWKPTVSLEEGIKNTIVKKQSLLKY